MPNKTFRIMLHGAKILQSPVLRSAIPSTRIQLQQNSRFTDPSGPPCFETMLLSVDKNLATFDLVSALLNSSCSS